MLKTKKLAFLTVFGVLAVALSVAGATYALFTDSTQNTDNGFTAGTVILNVERDSGDTVPGPMFYTSASDATGWYPTDKARVYSLGGEALGGWAPGDTATRAMNLYNAGTLAAKVTKLQATVNAAGLQSGDPALEEFIDKMNIKVTYTTGGNQILYNGSLRGLLNGWVNINPAMAAAARSGAMNVSFEAHLDSSAGNDIQGRNFVFDFSFFAEQLRNN